VLTVKLSRWVDHLAQERWLFGASVFRVIAGVAMLLEYVMNYGQRHYVFGPDAALAYDSFVAEAAHHRFSLYAFSSSPAFFEVVFHLGLAVTLAWTIGWRTRWLTPIVWLFLTSLHDRCPFLCDGGDNVIEIVLVYMMLADVSAHFSVGSRSPRAADRSLRGTIRGLLHNAAVVASGIQISVVYVVAGLSKVQGDTWRSGTALYYAIGGGEYGWQGHDQFIYQNAIVLTLLCYVTVGFQVAFPFLVLQNRVTRLFAIAACVAFHAGIAIYMGLVTFAAFMLAVDLAIVPDDEYRLIGRALRFVRDYGARLFASGFKARAALGRSLRTPARSAVNDNPMQWR
jgi:hypothetical protein